MIKANDDHHKMISTIHQHIIQHNTLQKNVISLKNIHFATVSYVDRN